MTQAVDPPYTGPPSPDAEIDITVCDGKYRVIWDQFYGFHALRYGKEWRDLTGDGLVLALAQEIRDLRERIAEDKKPMSSDWKQVVSQSEP